MIALDIDTKGPNMNQSFREMLYAGATTRIIGHYMVWHNGKHTVDPKRKVGYLSNDPVAAKANSIRLQKAGFDVLSPNWYGPGTYEDQCTLVLFNNSVLNIAVNIDGASFNSLDQLRTNITYVRRYYFGRANYEKYNGKYLVTFFCKDGNQGTWFRQVEQENPDIQFVYNGQTWGTSQMEWVTPDLSLNCDWFIRTFGHKTDGLYIPCVSAGFDDTNSLTGLGVWGANPARVWPAGVGPNWSTLRMYFAVINKYYSVSNQLKYLQAVTINDDDEGDGMLSRGFILPTPVPVTSHLEFWIDGSKWGQTTTLFGTQKQFVVNQVDSTGKVIGTANLAIKQ